MILSNLKPTKISVKEDIVESFFKTLDKKEQLKFLTAK